MSHLRNEMPSVFGKDKKKAELIKNLGDIYKRIQMEHDISPGDFPNLSRMQENLQYHDFTKFHPIRTKFMDQVDDLLANDIARLMAMIPQESETMAEVHRVKGGVFSSGEGTFNPFATGATEGFQLGAGTSQWIVQKSKPKYDAIFESLEPIDGKVSGASAKREMVKSRLPKNVLARIWALADVDKDGQLDEDEFALAMYLIDVKLKDDDDIPAQLPMHLVPPTKRKIVYSRLEKD